MSTEKTKVLSRRDFLRLVGVGAAGLGLAACSPKVKEVTVVVEKEVTKEVEKVVEKEVTRIIEPTKYPTLTATEQATVAPTATGTPEAAVATSTATPGADVIMVGGKSSSEKATVTSTATLAPNNESAEEQINFTGFRRKIDGGSVEVARDVFKNKTGVANFIFADPGAVLDPDYASVQKNKGHILMDPNTSHVLKSKAPEGEGINIPEGGFTLFSLGRGKIAIGDEFAITLPDRGQGHNYIVAVRGLYADGKQDVDRNKTAAVTEYVAGSAIALRYPSDGMSGIAFVSEGQMLQLVAESANKGSNCGNEGCGKLTLVALDVNTGALEVYEHVQGRSDNEAKAIKLAGENWERLFSNFR